MNWRHHKRYRFDVCRVTIDEAYGFSNNSILLKKINLVLYNLFVTISSAIVLPICWFINAMYAYKCSTMVLSKLITPKRKKTLFICSFLKRRLFFFFYSRYLYIYFRIKIVFVNVSSIKKATVKKGGSILKLSMRI